jgi:hypothetical protein
LFDSFNEYDASVRELGYEERRRPALEEKSCGM